jgi:hypothetical protein
VSIVEREKKRTGLRLRWKTGVVRNGYGGKSALRSLGMTSNPFITFTVNSKSKERYL